MSLILSILKYSNKILEQNKLYAQDQHPDILLSDNQFKRQATLQSAKCMHYCKSVSLFVYWARCSAVVSLFPSKVGLKFLSFSAKNLWSFHKVVVLFLSFLCRPTEDVICSAAWDTSICTHGRYIICETSSRKLSGLIGKIKLSIKRMNHIWQTLNDRLEEGIVREVHLSFKSLLYSQLQ